MGMLSGARVVLAEDEPLLLHILRDTLTLAGADVIDCASDLEGAVALAETSGVDAAVLDLVLRGQLSYPAARAFRRKGVPVIFASGSSADGMPLDLRSVRFVSKPYGYGELVAAIGDAIGAQAIRSAALRGPMEERASP